LSYRYNNVTIGRKLLQNPNTFAKMD